MLPFIKVSCIFVSTASFWIAVTPPNPPPAEDEKKAGSTFLEVFLTQRSKSSILKVSLEDKVFGTAIEIIVSSSVLYSTFLALLPWLRQQSSLPKIHSTTITFALVF